MIPLPRIFGVPVILLTGIISAAAQDSTFTTPYQFTFSQEIPHTTVKDQAHTGTCWCFSTISFLESEIMRKDMGEYDLSEMYVVRNIYPLKAWNYIRNHGDARFDEGGLSHDVIQAIQKFGMVPEEVYTGQNIGENRHDHREMMTVLSAILGAVLEKRGGKVTPRWPDALEGALNAYLGVPPAQFTYKGKSYTPQSFAKSLKLDIDHYVELTSFSHHPYYQKIRLELPDNWMGYSDYYNLPLDELEAMVDHSLQEGYSMVWDGDVSEQTFLRKKYGIAIIPLDDDKFAEEDRDDIAITDLIPEKEINQEIRQELFDNLSTTDDHLMHIVGLAHDQNGKKFFYVKDSGGTDSRYQGYLYLSESYFRLKTTGVMVHREAIPSKIRKKLNL